MQGKHIDHLQFFNIVAPELFFLWGRGRENRCGGIQMCQKETKGKSAGQELLGGWNKGRVRDRTPFSYSHFQIFFKTIPLSTYPSNAYHKG